jgi:hypothetical protein
MRNPMKIEEILDLWKEDSHIDRTELGDEALRIPKLHQKYYQIYIHERLNLRSLEAAMKTLKLDKYEFYTQGPNEDTPKDWKLPPKGLILKSDIPMYMDADSEIIKLSLNIGLQQEKLEFLESIIKSFGNRGYNIKAAIDWQKFTMGG